MSLCPVHDAVIVFVEHGVGMCYGCVRDLKIAIQQSDCEGAARIQQRLDDIAHAYAPSRAGERHALHIDPVPGCQFCTGADGAPV